MNTMMMMMVAFAVDSLAHLTNALITIVAAK
jgi:hypothetical protein